MILHLKLYISLGFMKIYCCGLQVHRGLSKQEHRVNRENMLVVRWKLESLTIECVNAYKRTSADAGQMVRLLVAELTLE